MNANNGRVERSAGEPSLVRPYSLTSGRTRPEIELAIEALIQSASPYSYFDLSNIESAIVELSGESPSIAEIAARLGVPLGVARVLVGDLIKTGHLRVSATLREDASKAERRDLIERVLSGLRGI
jgi:hypothetical protein